MTRAGGRARAIACLGAVILLLGSTPALAGWQEDYKEARTALNDGKLNKAETHFRSAIASKGAEKANAIKASGMFFEHYLPHFYLGMTLFQSKEYSEAAREFDLSESQGVIGKDAALMAQLSQMRSTAKSLAQSSSPPPPPPPAPPPPTIAETQPEPAVVMTPTGGAAQGGGAAEPETAKPTEPPPAVKSGGSKAAPSPSQGGRVTAEPLPPAPKPPVATGPDPSLTRAIDAAASEIAAAQKLAAESGDLLQPAEKNQLTSAASAILKSGTPAEAQSGHEKLRGLRADLGRKANQRRQDNEAKVALDAARLRKALEGRSAQAAQPPKPSGADPAIAVARREYATGVEAYFGGDFDRAIPALVKAGDTIQDDPGLHALLGSALYKRYLLTRSTDDSLKARAGEAFRTALGIRPGFTLDAKYYPPKVIAFFKQVASGAPGPSGQ